MWLRMGVNNYRLRIGGALCDGTIGGEGSEADHAGDAGAAAPAIASAPGLCQIVTSSSSSTGSAPVQQDSLKGTKDMLMQMFRAQ